jgi:hypothetical protein
LEIHNVVRAACPIWFMNYDAADKYLLSIRWWALKVLGKSQHLASDCRYPVAKSTGGNVQRNKQKKYLHKY